MCDKVLNPGHAFNIPLQQQQVVSIGSYFLRYRMSLNGENYGNFYMSSMRKKSETGHSDVDVNYLKSLDPKDWKNQDHYAVLGLQNIRFYATQGDIKRAYRKMVLSHHPDKRRAKGENIQEDSDYFTCITRAYEILGTPKLRRSYDSVDPEFDDSVPSTNQIEKGFFKTFEKYFMSNGRWSESKTLPSFGNENSSREEVEYFYSFWYNFESWREYSYLDEEDKEKGQDREERRWIEKQNKIIRIKRKKEEMSRIRSLVDLAYNNDPRILKFKSEEKEKKLAAKRAKVSALQAQKERQESEIREIENAKLQAQHAEQQRVEQIRMEKEQQRRLLKKERKSLRDITKDNNYFSTNDIEKLQHMEGVEKICKLFKLLELQNLNKELLNNNKICFLKALQDIDNRIEQERWSTASSSNKNLSALSSSKLSQDTQKSSDKLSIWRTSDIQLLIKAVNLFPAGTLQRWEVIAKFMNQHSNDEQENKFVPRQVLNKAKDLRSMGFSKGASQHQPNGTEVVCKKEITNNTSEDDKNLNENLHTIDPKTDIVLKNTVHGISRGFGRPWTKDEQALLEQAIKTYPISTQDRWDKIAACIPNRSKKECLKRVKELVDRVNAKKDAQLSVT